MEFVNDAAMREGPRRPSLLSGLVGSGEALGAAMREGRRRPSLQEDWRLLPGLEDGRNEGGAPAPLVARTF